MPAGEASAARWAITTGQMEIDCVVVRGNHRIYTATKCFLVVLRKNGLELLTLLVNDF